jgi:hypothetical protein
LQSPTKAHPGGAAEMPRAFGLHLPLGAARRVFSAGPATGALSPDQATSWKSWVVVPRALGFHVSRETKDGNCFEFLLNEVRAVKVFRKRELADAACAEANGALS